jgi:hypothetical protein
MIHLTSEDIPKEFENFLQNKYTKYYVGIVQSIRDRGVVCKAEAKRLLGYVESHHIFPVSLYPELSKDKSNLIFCTAREHFLLHRLLGKMTVGKDHNKMLRAVCAFSMIQDNQHRFLRARDYEVIRKAHVESKSGENSHLFGADGTIAKGSVGYNNGVVNKFIAPGEIAPAGFVKGILYVKGSIQITNGVERSFLRPGQPMPEGWFAQGFRTGAKSTQKGKPRPKYVSDEKRLENITKSKQGIMWITDGTVDSTTFVGCEIPVGWRKGRTHAGKKVYKPCPHCGKLVDAQNYNRHISKCERKSNAVDN